MITNDKYYIVGIDGGASKTRGILMNENGMTLATAFDKGTNLTVYGVRAAERIVHIISELCQTAKISFDQIDAVGLGLAGASDQDGRDHVFRKLDALNLSKRALIANDAEAAYEINCPGEFGILVTVGTGIICLSRNSEGKTIRVAGLGHDKGDIGSGYWMGKQAIINLTLNESSILGDKYLEEIMSIFLQSINEDDFQTALQDIKESEDSVQIIAQLAAPVIQLAEAGNNIALSVVQEATHAVANYIISITDELNYSKKNIILAGNGSVIQNDYFRGSINDELRFQFPDIKWIFSTISPAYGAGLMAARLNNIDIKISDILKGEALAAA
jgi:N-acetylglucosamine kinase-like BadF-type ATPase